MFNKKVILDIPYWYKDQQEKWHHFIEDDKSWYLDGKKCKNAIMAMYEYGLYKFANGGNPVGYRIQGILKKEAPSINN